jgi:hypothetical protein
MAEQLAEAQTRQYPKQKKLYISMNSVLHGWALAQQRDNGEILLSFANISPEPHS